MATSFFSPATPLIVLAALVPGGVERAPDVRGEVTRQVRVELEGGSVFSDLPDVVVVGTEIHAAGNSSSVVRRPGTQLPAA